MAAEALFIQQRTPWGGRGLYAVRDIPKDTLVHVCPGPYAATIDKVFRKEVCGYCFAYAFDSGRNTWNIRYNESGSWTGSAWFCSELCKTTWLDELNVGGLLSTVNANIDRLDSSLKKSKSKATPAVTLPPVEITDETISLAWKQIEALPMNTAREVLEEIELDMAKFLVSAIVRKYLEDDHTVKAGSDTWNGLLGLQDNELSLYRNHPEAFASHLRVYTFLRSVAAPTVLQPYVQTSDTIRAVLARDSGNVFGLYDMATSGDSEMLGYGMYVSASYFNHDCTPNIQKKRVGRAMQFFTKRDVVAGDELCISYIDIEDSVDQRRANLLQHWYFDCLCTRCTRELAAASI